jgi:hypothetical protein
MDSTAIEDDPEKFSIIINAANLHQPPTKSVGARPTGLRMIRPVTTNIAIMRLLNSIGLTSSDQREGKFLSGCRYRGHDSGGFFFAAFEMDPDIVWTCSCPDSQTIWMHSPT